jgi:hypothetical protein
MSVDKFKQFWTTYDASINNSWENALKEYNQLLGKGKDRRSEPEEKRFGELTD